MQKAILAVPLVLTLSLSLTGPASAAVTSGKILEQTGMGRFVKLKTDIPFTVGQDHFDTSNLYAFDEDQDIVLDMAIAVDIGGIDGAIRAGTRLSSHYVFFDSLSDTHFGFVTFDAPILGIAAHQDTLAATDFLANDNVDYVATELRGLESGDRVWIDPDDPRRLFVFWSGSSPGDYIRVFTDGTPSASMM